MGRIIDSDKMFNKYLGIRNQDYFVDKSKLINKLNKLIEKDESKYVCITKPRRFGKTSIAAMLVTYYSKGINSKKIFDELKVSKVINSDKNENKVEIDQYNKFQKKYHTIYFDFSYDVDSYKTLKGYLKSINKDLKKDIKDLYPNSNILKKYSRKIYKNLQEVFVAIKEKFIIIIDEWDYIISNNLFTPKEQKKYIAFLKNLIKDQVYVAFVYMTGILPIAKQMTQSTINCFNEYSMLNDKDYYQYFGFTEQEVIKLCEINKTKYNENETLEYENIENWYNGYKGYNGKKIFNSWSVYHALQNNRIENYWIQTGRFNEVVDSIDFKIHGVKNDILDLIKGDDISIELEKYGVEDLLKDTETNDSQEKTKKDNDEDNINKKKQLYSKMVTYGFLTYCNGKISIPNKELQEEFIKILKKKKT
ncbi:hypothetical protein H8356DRAFT_604864 [Neocallimastix lanati (nom. inval.)]|nr:hypothetical protein H8356DRAFT_604864 [Neocallimastix sp. JGI-2020a]